MSNQPERKSTPGAMFRLGRVVATPHALAALQEVGWNPLVLLARHVVGDWGDVDLEDAKENDYATNYGGRIFSSYSKNGVKFWVITEADRSSTCVLLPEDY